MKAGDSPSQADTESGKAIQVQCVSFRCTHELWRRDASTAYDIIDFIITFVQNPERIQPPLNIFSAVNTR